MKLALFGSGGAISEAALRGLASHHEVRALVSPQRHANLRSRLRPLAVRLGFRRDDPLCAAARELRVPLLTCAGGSDASLRDALRRLDLDLIVIAAFPYLLAPEIFRVPRFGAVNVHSSLLPRHRGPLPLFWVYHRDDRETGVTVHEVTEEADTGRILAQTRFDLPRGYPINQLHDRCAMEGAQLVARVLSRWEEHARDAVPQDERMATPAPRIKAGTSMVNFAEWPVERVWHFLKGMYPHFVEPVTDERGKPVAYTGIADYEETAHTRRPGKLEPSEGGYRLFCLGGSVLLNARGGAR